MQYETFSVTEESVQKSDLETNKMLTELAEFIHFYTRVPQTFEELLPRCLNCDPAQLYGLLSSMVAEGALIHRLDDRGKALYFSKKKRKRNLSFVEDELKHKPRMKTETVPARSAETDAALRFLQSALPEPSPAYYQWWFSSLGYKKSLELCSKLASGPVAFLGSATLGALFSQVCSARINILDIDSYLLSCLSGLCGPCASFGTYDVADEIDSSLAGSHSLAYVDPPWSRSLLPVFLLRGASLLAQNGRLAISVPQLFTRPTIRQERIELLSLASNLGMEVEAFLPSYSEYNVPPFEAAAFLAQGIHLSKPWRKGDLFIFRKRASLPIAQSLRCIYKRTRWSQFVKTSWRLFVRRDGEAESGKPEIREIEGVINGVCTNTSSRAALWKKASLVTTRNVFAEATGRESLCTLLPDILASFEVQQESPNSEIAYLRHNLARLISGNGEVCVGGRSAKVE